MPHSRRDGDGRGLRNRRCTDQALHARARARARVRSAPRRAGFLPVNRLPVAQRILLYGVLSGLLATGVVWEALDRGPAASLVMKIHGALAMAVLIVVGTLLAHHVPAGWATLKNRWSGICLLAVL